MNVKRLKNQVFVFLVMLFVISLNPAASYAAEQSGKVALTPPPPKEMQIQSFFDPSNKYLDQGKAFIKDNLNQSVTVSVITEAKSDVTSIGGTVYLQKWTGSEWIDVGSGTTIQDSNTWYFSGEVVKSVEKGYYFRARVMHWISNNGTYEQGQTTSDYILAG
ncbi:hypothetical protein ACFQ88_22510 [Paenibacillus sp. NPDC056579]|uniref:hypothetical protein n=1 Tax=Paenibacillus sp. NPDC056579 TaxID=3345871 RepID=UPI00367D676F